MKNKFNIPIISDGYFYYYPDNCIRFSGRKYSDRIFRVSNRNIFGIYLKKIKV